jgi:hypothetical protein
MVLILAGATSEAVACGFCLAASANSVLPPIGLWILLAMTWFVAGGAIRTFTRIRLPWQPPLLGSVLLAVGLAVLGAAMFGPFIVLPLFAPPIRGFVGSLFPSPSAEITRGIRATRIAGWVHVCGILFATTLMVHTHLTRTTEEYISKSTQPDGAANRSQPFRSETNSTSSAAGSRR